MKMFTWQRDVSGVRLISTQGKDVGWDCAADSEIDHLIEQIKTELDDCAAGMKAALAEPVRLSLTTRDS